MANRFRVFKTGLSYVDRQKVFSSNSTEGCRDFLKTQDLGLNSFMVDDTEDDIEVSADDFMQAWQEGECPGDLQMF